MRITIFSDQLLLNHLSSVSYFSSSLLSRRVMLETKLRGYENFHIVLWLFKDTCWLMEWQLGGVIMIVPTILAAMHITWLDRKNIANLFHNLAVSSWICGNAVWMIGDFFFNDQFRPYAKILFSLGFVFLAVYYLGIGPKRFTESKLRRN